MASETKLNLPLADDLFGITENGNANTIIELPLSEITPLENHPFKVKEDEKMLEMVESIQESGVLVPAIVRSKDGGGYEMIAGHRRHMASLLAGKPTIPCIIKELSNDEATIIMVDSNLQREEILPSEKAFAYKMKLDAMKRRVGRPKNNSAPLEPNLRSNEELSKKVDDSVSQIKRYIRLTELTEPLLIMTDDKKIGFRIAVELSYLTKSEQEDLLYQIEQTDCTPSMEQAKKLKQFSKDGTLNENVIKSILQEEKPNQKETVKIEKDRISKFFKSDEKPEKIQETIYNALDFYKKYRNKVNELEKPKDKGSR